MTGTLSKLDNVDFGFLEGDDPFDSPPLKPADLHLPHGYTMLQVCRACPEAYDVKDSAGNQWAYLRVRHGTFTVEVPDARGELLASWQTDGDGTFNRSERYYWLNRALKMCKLHYLLEDPNTVDELDQHDFSALVVQLLEQTKPQSDTLSASVDRVIARLNKKSG